VHADAEPSEVEEEFLVGAGGAVRLRLHLAQDRLVSIAAAFLQEEPMTRLLEKT